MANIAVQGTSDDMLEAARYFQTLPMQEDRAILLYHKVYFSKEILDPINELHNLGWTDFESN
jgi:hypothetical protein